jgi:hypothetical protein
MIHNNSGYARGCRCEICIEAKREYLRKYDAMRAQKKQPSEAERRDRAKAGLCVECGQARHLGLYCRKCAKAKAKRTVLD